MITLASRLAILAGASLIAMTAATQDFAHHYAYAPALGYGLGIEIEGHRLYPPWEIVRWLGTWGEEVRQGAISAARGASVVLGAMALVAAAGLMRRTVRPFGRRQLGRLADAERADLLARDGLVLGRMRGLLGISRTLRDHSDRHLLVLGATRSGKGVSVVVPTLLDGWRHSAVVWDPKGELHELTAKARPGRTFVLDPMSPASARLNPLAEIRIAGSFAVADAQALAETLIDPAGEHNSHDFWDRSAANFLAALILHVASTGTDRTLGRVRDMALDVDATIEQMKGSTHAEVRRVADATGALEEKVRSSIEATVQSHLGVLADDSVRHALSGSDLRVGDLMCSAEPVTLYISASPAHAARLRPLVRLLLQQIIRGLTAHLEHDERGALKRHPLLMMIDELPLLGRLPVLEQALAHAAGAGVRFALVAQSMVDVDRCGSMIDNCGLIWARPTNDSKGLQRLSDMVGRTTEMRRSVSRLSSTWSEQTRPIMEPADIRRLPDGKALLFAQGAPPMLVDRVLWYRDRPWRRWAKVPPIGPALAPPTAPQPTQTPRDDDLL